MEESSTPDHRSVIGAELDRRIAEANSEREEFLLQTSAQAGIGRDAARQHDLLDMVLLGGEARLHRQDIDDCLLEAGRQQGDVGRTLLRGLRAHAGVLAHLPTLTGSTRILARRAFGEVEHRRLEAAKAEIVGTAQPGTRQAIGRAPRVSGFFRCCSSSSTCWAAFWIAGPPG